MLIQKKIKENNNLNQNDTIFEYTPLIKLIARKISLKTNSSIDLDELINQGVLGLIDAINKYNYTKNNSFKTYAEFRIRGAILDYLRQIDVVPRSVRDRIKKIEKAKQEVQYKEKRQANSQELAAALNLNIKEYEHYKNLADPNTFTDNANNLEAINNKCPEYYLLKNSLKNELVLALKTLNNVEISVINLYYFEDLNLKEIKKVLNLSLSRICQIHKSSIEKLKNKLSSRKKELFTTIS